MSQTHQPDPTTDDDAWNPPDSGAYPTDPATYEIQHTPNGLYIFSLEFDGEDMWVPAELLTVIER